MLWQVVHATQGCVSGIPYADDSLGGSSAPFWDLAACVTTSCVYPEELLVGYVE